MQTGGFSNISQILHEHETKGEGHRAHLTHEQVHTREQEHTRAKTCKDIDQITVISLIRLHYVKTKRNK